MSILSRFITKWNNQKIDFDGAYGHQCFDLVNQYRYEVTGLNPTTTLLDYAYQIFHEPNRFFNPETRYERIFNDYNDINQIPQNGDIIVWNENMGAGAGHVAIVTDAQPSNFEVLEQNAGNGDGQGDDDRTKLSRYADYRNVSGWLRILSPIEEPIFKTPFHLQTEEELTDWVQKWGLARIRETGGRDYIREIDTLQNINNQLQEYTQTLSTQIEDLQQKKDEKFTFSWNKQIETIVKSGTGKYLIAVLIITGQSLLKNYLSIDIPTDVMISITGLTAVSGLTDTITYLDSKFKR